MMIHFYKYQATGNDFIIINNLNNTVNLHSQDIEFLCNRKLGIGADGLILIEKKLNYDFYMNYFNADGKQGSMCGNGGRASVLFFYEHVLSKDNYCFYAPDGVHHAQISSSKIVSLQMKNIHEITPHENDHIIDTGSPHYLKYVSNIDHVVVVEEGKKIRNSAPFKEKGINVNFIEDKINHICVATFERGVEDETLSCGTGVTASAILWKKNILGENMVDIVTKGGHLQVKFTNFGNHNFQNVWLQGASLFVFNGSISL